MLREGVKGLWGREDGQQVSVQLLVVTVGVRVKDNAKRWKRCRHTCSGRGRKVGQYFGDGRDDSK